MINEQYKHSDLTGKIIGCSMEVQNILGKGFQEEVYQRAISIEMNFQNLLHEREKEIPLTYKDHDIGTRRVDFFVDEKKLWWKLRPLRIWKTYTLRKPLTIWKLITWK